MIKLVLILSLLATFLMFGAVDAKQDWTVAKDSKFSFKVSNKRLGAEVYFRLSCIDHETVRLQVGDPSAFDPQRLVLDGELPSIECTHAYVAIELNKQGTSPIMFQVTSNVDRSKVYFKALWNEFEYTGDFIKFGGQYSSDETPNLYGLGERVHNFRLDTHGKNYTMWNQDNGTPEDKNLYGTHPFWMVYEQKRVSFHGAFMLNTNAMNVHVNGNRMQYYIMGHGKIDFFVFAGQPTPEALIKKYHNIIGKPNMIPYFSLGHHHCRWGYKNVAETKKVADTYRKLEIPLDTMWNDIDYMDGYRVFTNDPVNYPLGEYQEFIESLHQNNQHYILIVDPGIKIDPDYFAYQQLLKAGSYIRNPDGKPYVNEVWPGKTIFPDFTNDKSFDFWAKNIAEFKKKVNVDGLWIDMNEIAGECNGQCKDQATKTMKIRAEPPNHLQLDYKTVAMDAVHNVSTEFYVHNLYGFLEGKATAQALADIDGKRPFIISRSTFAGTGRYNNHWLGDNLSTYRDMFMSISGVLSFQLFGIPMVGPDMCGFGKDTTPELCARWVQLASFFPFSRNHNDKDSIPQEFYALGDMVVKTAKQALSTRLSIIPYFYTLFNEVHKNGGTVIRPIFWNFPEDQNPDLPKMDRYFMVGSSLLVTPILEEGKVTTSTYLSPKAIWYDFYTGELDQCSTFCQVYNTLDNPVVSLHIRGGSILPMHSMHDQHGVKAINTAMARQNGYEFLVAPDKEGRATGQLYIDEGSMIDQPQTLDITMTYHNKTLLVEPQGKYRGQEGVVSIQVNTVKVFGDKINQCTIKTEYIRAKLRPEEIQCAGHICTLDLSGHYLTFIRYFALICDDE